MGACDFQKFLKERTGQTVAAMGRRDGDFVEEEFGWFVGVDVVNAGGEADYDAGVDGYRDVVARISEEFAGEGGIDRVIENVWSDVLQKGFVGRT
jgi:hypothetical protein